MNRLNLAIAAEFELCEKIVESLEQSQLDIEKLTAVEIYPFSEEQGLRFNNKAVAQVKPEDAEWSDFDYLLFAGKAEQAQYLAQAAESGCVVIDLKGICATLEDVPVVVPSVNNEQLIQLRQRNIVSLPDVQISQLALSIADIVAENGINQVIVNSLLPASYSGEEKVKELAGQTARLLNGLPLEDHKQRLAFDVFPENSAHLATQFEKIFPQLNLVTQSIQVPVFYGLSQQISLFYDYPINLEQQYEKWQSNELIKFEPSLITAVTNGEQENSEEQVKLHISQLQQIENATQSGLQLWTVADDQRFGLALLGVKLLELIYQQGY